MASRCVVRLAMWGAGCLAGALATGLAQQHHAPHPHPHITRVTWQVGSESLDWETREFGRDEKPTGRAPEHFFIAMRNRLMSADGEERRFSQEEASQVGAGLGRMVGFISKRVLSLDGDRSLNAITWEPPAGTIELEVKDASVRTYTVNKLGVLTDDSGQPAALDKRVHAVLVAMSASVIRYATESVYWWRAGQGERVTNKTRASLDDPIPGR